VSLQVGSPARLAALAPSPKPYTLEGNAGSPACDGKWAMRAMVQRAVSGV
jgi:hypothetical protein